MHRLKRYGVVLAVAIAFVGGSAIYKKLDGKSETTALKVGECVFASDVPSYSDALTATPTVANDTVSGDYPVVPCAEWQTQKEPEQIMQVRWQYKVDDSTSGPESNSTRIANMCDGYAIYELSKNGGVTCLQYMAVLDDMKAKNQSFFDDVPAGSCIQDVERPDGLVVAQNVACETPSTEATPTFRVISNDTAATFEAAEALGTGCTAEAIMPDQAEFIPDLSRVLCVELVS